MAFFHNAHESSTNINSENLFGETALHVAVIHDDVEIVKYLLKQGADINIKTRRRVSDPPKIQCECICAEYCFHDSDEMGNEMKTGRDVGQNVLHLAAKHASSELVRLLLPFIYNVDQTSEDQSTALHYVTLNHQDDGTDVRIAELLLYHGADLEARNNDGKSPLYLAVKLERLQLVGYLLAVGANPNALTYKCSTPIHSAIMNENVELTATLLMHGAAASNFKSHEEPLAYALRVLNRGDSRLHIVELLLNSGANPCFLNNEGSTPLHEALKDNDFAMAHMLLQHGSSPVAKDSQDMSPLALVVKERKGLAFAQLLLQAGASADDSWNYDSLLKMAVSDRDEELVKLLLAYGAAAKGTASCNDEDLLLCALPLVRNQRGLRLRMVSLLLEARIKSQTWLALHVAVADNDAALARLLLQHGAMPNSSKNQFNIPAHSATLEYPKFADVLRILNLRGISFGKYFKSASMLEYATKNCNEAMVRVLMEYGAPAYGSDPRRKPACCPLGMAVQMGNMSLARLMLELGSTIENPADTAPLLERAIKQDNFEMAKLLLDHGANANQCEGLLQHAIDKSNVAIVKLLLDSGITVPGGVLKYAISKCACDEAIVKMLLDHGVDVNFGDDDDKPIIVASMKSNDRVMKMIIAAGADINCKDSAGRTPLMIATQYSRFDIMRYLIDHGAKINEIDNEGNTALHILLLIKDQYLRSQGIKMVIREFIDAFLDAGASINIENHKGHTPFRYMLSNRFEKHEKNTLLKHLAYLKTLKSYVNPVNLSYIKDNNLWASNVRIYQEELERMKTMMIIDKHSFYHVIVDPNYSPLIPLFRERDALMLFKHSMLFNGIKYYTDMLFRYFHRKYERFCLMNRSACLLSDIFQSKLPPECARKIAEHYSCNALKELLNDHILEEACNT